MNDSMHDDFPQCAIIEGIGTACPDHAIAQADAAALACSLRPSDPEQRRLVPVLYRRANVRKRGSVLLSNGVAAGAVSQDFFPVTGSSVDRGPGTSARLDRYAIEAPKLAAKACEAALRESGGSKGITHLITVSCTGFMAPGLDAALIGTLNLNPGVQRTNIGFMGCHGAINGLRVSQAFARADANARVLLCAVEICSVHFHYTSDPEQLVANALFADGAAAMVIGREGDAHGQRPRAMRLVACGSWLIPDSIDAMTWRIGDHGFEMTLSPRVPALLDEHLSGWLIPWLASNDLTPAQVGSWAIHPGGPRLLGTVGECLGLDDASLHVSRCVLADHGNMSSPTVLFIVDELRRRRAPLPYVALAFGPGLVAEALLIR